jgi:hypothetical protein
MFDRFLRPSVMVGELAGLPFVFQGGGLTQQTENIGPAIQSLLVWIFQYWEK